MSKYTEKAIVDSFMSLLRLKSFDKITVKEIIEGAQINRNTFYYHYEDIFALLEHVFDLETQAFRAGYKPDCTFLEEYERAADTLQVHKEAIMHIYHSSVRHALSRYFEEVALHFVGLFVGRAAENTCLSPEGREYITCFYSYAVIGETLKWIERQMPDYREGLIQTISSSFEDTVQEMILSYIKGHPAECHYPGPII